MNIPKVEYDVYSKLNGSNLVKLNLSFCQNLKIDLSVPVNINENIDKLNSKSGYYNDICYISTTETGTDIILKDRKKEFIEGNKTLCQDNCDFSDYDYETNKAICKCDVKESSSSTADMIINKTKLYENFVDIKNIANINLLVCYKTLFTKKGIVHNIGALTIIPIILLHLICIVICYINKFSEIKEKIKDIIFGIQNWKLVKAEEKEKKKKEKMEKLRKEKETMEKLEQKKETENKEKEKNFIKIKKFKKEYEEDDITRKNMIKLPSPFDMYYMEKYKNLVVRKIKKKNNNPPKKREEQITDNINNNILTINNRNKKNNNTSIIKNKESVLQKTKEIMNFNDLELNQLPYKLALKYDKRTYFQYYISLIKTKHNLIFSFYYSNDYNAKIIKIDLFFISFVIYYTVNALFFNDNTMHKIYEDKGKFSFFYQLPQIIYSSLISSLLNVPLNMLALSESDILELKKIKTIRA